jgi:hypothetical protein
MNNVLNPEPQPQYGMGPPPPMATQGPNAVPTPTTRPGNNSYANRPDLNMSRSNFMDDGINIRESYEKTSSQNNNKSSRSMRPDMKGPSDISDILSGLKTKTINIQNPTPQPQQVNDSSTISINDLKELQGDGNLPKKSRRRQKSSSNTISLDI